jgi:hypothetical protein
MPDMARFRAEPLDGLTVLPTEALAAGRAAFAAAAATDRLDGYEIWDLEESVRKRSGSPERDA